MHQSKSPKDSIDGSYAEILTVMGVAVSVKYFRNFKLVSKGDYRNGYLNDLMSVDSVGNIVRHLPIVEWVNIDEIETLDTLEFVIKNVDSLTYYQYSYATTLLKYELDRDVTRKQKPINIKDYPAIKIPASELRGTKILFIACGVLYKVKDSANIGKHYWGYFMNEFELK